MVKNSFVNRWNQVTWLWGWPGSAGGWNSCADNNVEFSCVLGLPKITLSESQELLKAVISTVTFTAVKGYRLTSTMEEGPGAGSRRDQEEFPLVLF